MQLVAPESLTVSPIKALLEGTELPLLTANCRNEFARFSNTFFSPWHKSSQSPYLVDARSPELSTTGAARTLVVGVGAAIDAAGCGVAAGAEAACGCGASGFTEADSSKVLDGGAGFRARFTEEFNQKEILAVPSLCRTVCRCNGHCPR